MPFTPVNPQQKGNFTPVNPQADTISHGGVPLLLQPKLSSNPIIAGVQNFGTGAGKGAMETIRGLGQMGTEIQNLVTKTTGITGPQTDIFNEGGVIDQSTTPQGTMQKIGYGAETAMELLTPTGGKAGASIAEDTTKAAGKGVKQVSSIATGVPKDVLTRAATPEYAPKIEKAITQIEKNPTQPYLDLAQETATGIKNAETSASENLTTAIDNFKKFQGNTKFDVSQKIQTISDALKPFSTSGLKVTQLKDASGKFGRFVIDRSPQSSFTDKEVKELQDIMDTIRNSKGVDIDNLLSLRKKMSTAYDAIPLGVNGNPRPYHAALMAMKKETENAIDGLLPKELKQANNQYRLVQDMKDAFGNRIVDAQGNLKDNAEQFLSNLGNMNKGELRKQVDKYRELTGIDLTDEIQVMKDAQKLSPLFATTGSRTQDILRAVLTTALGTGVAGPVGGLGILATSPKVAGKVATTVGKAKGFIKGLIGSPK